MSKTATPFVERLPCKLSGPEKEVKADELARTVNQRDSLVLERSISAQRFARSIKEADRRIGDLAEEVRTGVEFRQVQVTERRDFERNVVEVVRLDTHEVCGHRAMRGEERQAEMFPKRAAGADGGDPLAEALGPDDEEEGDELDDDGDPVDDDDDGDSAAAH